MKKIILITILCASLMLITPLTSVAQENKISNNLSDKPDIDGLVVQIRTAVDEILQKYGHIPMVRSQCDVILNTLDWFPGNIVFCIFLILIILSLEILFFLLLRLDIASYTLWVILLILFSYSSSYCNPLNSFNINLSHQPIFTLSETNDSTNQLDGCPCLQE